MFKFVNKYGQMIIVTPRPVVTAPPWAPRPLPPPLMGHPTVRRRVVKV